MSKAKIILNYLNEELPDLKDWDKSGHKLGFKKDSYSYTDKDGDFWFITAIVDKDKFLGYVLELSTKNRKWFLISPREKITDKMMMMPGNNFLINNPEYLFDDPNKALKKAQDLYSSKDKIKVNR